MKTTSPLQTIVFGYIRLNVVTMWYSLSNAVALRDERIPCNSLSEDSTENDPSWNSTLWQSEFAFSLFALIMQI